MSRAVRLHEYGGLDVLQVEDVSDPVPGPGEALVRVRATSINPGEAKIREGALHSRYPSTFPSGEGSDFAGVVEAVGVDVTAVGVGDEVIGYSDNRAAQAELVAVTVENLTPKPAEVPWEVAGSLYVAGCTAWAAVRAVLLRSGDTVAIAGAAGGVGVFAVQLAHAAGATVIAIAGESKHDWLRAHGAEPVAYGDGVEDRIRAVAPDGIDAFLDLVGGGYVEIALALGVKADRIDTIADFSAPEKYGVKADGNAAGASAATLAELAADVAGGSLEVPIAATYSLDQVRDAYAELEQGHTLGKIVLLPSSGGWDRRAAEILDRVRAVPAGYVRTYGDVSPGAPRVAGAVLSACGDGEVPWHRIVRADGSLAKGRRQRRLLMAEGVPFRGERVDMRVARVPW